MNAPPSVPRRPVACRLLLLALVAAAGCNANPGVSAARRTNDAISACVELLRSVTNAETARAATPKIKPAFADLTAALEANAAIDGGTVRGYSGQIRQIQNDLNRNLEAFNGEMERLNELTGLPAEFWNVFRVEYYKFTLFMGKIAAGVNPAIGAELIAMLEECVGMYERHGPERVLDLTLSNVLVGDKDAAIARLRELAGSDAEVVEVPNPEDADECYVLVAPVDDFDKLVADVDFGDVTEQDKAKGEATIELPDAAPEAAETAETADAAEAGEFASADASEYAAQRSAFDEYGNPIPPDPDGETASAGGERPNGLRGLFENAAATSRFNNLAAGVSAVIAAERAAIAARAANGPQPGDRDYHAAMAELLYDPQSQHHQRAVTELLEVKPTDVADKKIRARIANGYRQLAFAENSSHAPQAIDGLVHWGGKFSAPLLIQLLDKQTGAGDDAIFTGLGKAATPEAADAIVKRLQSNTGAGGEAAFAALKTMGPVAEPALIAALPFEQPDANRSAIEVLGEIGTRKSLSILRRAAKSENEEVKEAALAALRSIQERLRTEKATAATPTTAVVN
jgi:hypothetical protein